MSFKVIGIGEVLWDLLPSGPKLGGAPANFAYHAHALGADARIITRVGVDDLGKEIIERVKSMELPLTGIQMDDSAPTGTVTVALDSKGNPQYTIHENTAWDRIEATPEALAEVRQADAICFGSLAQRSPVSHATIQALAAAAPAESLRVFDINIRQHFYTPEVVKRSLELANILKLNEDEAPILAEMLGVYGDPKRQIETLSANYNLRLTALTKGGEGSLLYQDGAWSKYKSPSVDVVDTVGAGDSFTAALVLGLLYGESLESVHKFASEVAAFVCSCAGATPTLPERFIQRYRNSRGI
jgi:fructokinase